jgi:predicted RNase H-like nuclease
MAGAVAASVEELISHLGALASTVLPTGTVNTIQVTLRPKWFALRSPQSA